MKQSHTLPVAIVGVGALFPGSNDPGRFWQNILEGRDLIGDVPPERWRVDDFYDPDQTIPGKTYAKRGAFLDAVPFDPLHFGVPPTVVPKTDTSQLLALIVAQQVLDDAANGQFADLDRERMSVILGVTAGQELMNEMASSLQRPIWQKALREAGLPEDEVQDACDRIYAHFVKWEESTFPGLLGNVVAGRIANRFDLGGTNCVTDAACASAFSAMHMAINELYLGDSDVVIAGGVDTFNDIFMYMCFSKTPALSATGDCRPFSDQADGTLLGEGMAMFALKRLEDAERDGDHIYAVVQGVGSSSDGRSKSIYAPLSSGQAKALTRAYEHAGYGAETVELLEAHGTGTKAGDVAEFGGLREVFDATGRADRQWCALGSVKSQVGHTKAAAGAAGLFKAVMALHHKVLPPTLKVDRPNPKLSIEESPFYLSTYSRPWIRGADHPRRAGISAFGFGGSNFHVTVEEYGGEHQANRFVPWNAQLLLASGSADEVAQQCRGWIDELADGRPLSSIARESHSKFDSNAAGRLAIVCDRDQARQRLTQAIDLVTNQPERAASLPTGIEWGVGETTGEVAFLFPGQGSQRLEMGADLAMAFNEARKVWDELSTEALEGTTRLCDVVFPPPAFDEDTRSERNERLTATEWAQPALGVSSLATLAVLRAAGVDATHFGGHSFGEVTALAAAGVVSAADAMRIARKRGELMAEAAANTPGAMTAVQAPPDRVQEVLDQCGADVVIANENGPRQTVISGPVDGIEVAEAALTDARIAVKRLRVATAFHSPVVADSTAPFRTFLDGMSFGEPNGTVWSNAKAEPYDGDVVETLSSAIAQPVRFATELQAMAEAGATTFIEVGPGSILTRIASRILSDAVVVATDSRDRDGVTQLWHTFATLAARGVEFDLSPLWKPFGWAADPRDADEPKMTIPVAGGNVGKPYPPADPAELPAPNPPRPAPVAAPRTPTMSQNDDSNRSNPQPAPAAPQTTGSPDAWLQVFQDGQRQLAEAHSAYQRAMAESHVAFLKAVETSQASLASMLSGQPVSMPQPTQPAQPAPQFTQPAPQAPPVAPRQPVQAASPVAPAPVPQAPAAPAPVQTQQPAAKAAPAPSGDLESVLLAAVADKTGYPAEMLTMDMKLEADLGIDSIKRVEILSAVNEALPELPEVDGTRMAELNTLGEIHEFMQSEMGAPAPVATAPVAKPKAVAAPASDDGDLETVLLASVADKTGYPAEMLTMEMKLEADLGIDSIKRVEILSAVNEALPELPEVDAASMAELTTLGEILGFMQDASGEKKKPAAAE